MAPTQTRLTDLAELILDEAYNSLDPSEQPNYDRRFIAPGPRWARDMGCNLLVVHVLRTQYASALPPPGVQRVPHVVNTPGTTLAHWVVTLVTDCVPLGEVHGATYTPPAVDELTDFAEMHVGNAWDIWRGVRDACASGELFGENCQHVTVTDLDFDGPSGRAVTAFFTVSADMV